MLVVLVAYGIAASGQALIMGSSSAGEHQPDKFEEELREAKASYPAHANESDTVIPNKEKFRECYETRMENVRRVPTRPNGKTLLLGVFTTLGNDVEQQVIRSTWMRTPGLCIWDGQGAPKPGCSVWVAFVLGRNTIRWMDEKYSVPNDAILLSIDENMEKGKTFTYFHDVARKYPWVTDIGKLDMDTFPYVADLVDSIDDPSRCTGTPYEYWGLPNGACMGPFNQSCAANSCMKAQKCFLCMQGGLYGMTRALAMQATEPGTPWAMRPKGDPPPQDIGGAEDRVTGYRMQNWAEGTGKCVSTFDVSNAFSHKISNKAKSPPACEEAFRVPPPMPKQ